VVCERQWTGRANLRLSLSIVKVQQCRGYWSDQGEAVDVDAVKAPNCDECLGRGFVLAETSRLEKS
jgi:hypothetical protein